MAYISLISSYQLECKFIELSEIITGIRDAIRLETQPSNRLEYALEISGLFRFRVRVIVSQITMSTMVCRVTKIDKDGLGVSNMKIAVWFGRETRKDLAARREEVFLA